jgi:ElaB/YqjD/DUF883 family membrane-anchored ribosome-binding protein
MNNPFSSKPSQDPVPPLSDQAGAVERESEEQAAARAGESSRIASVAENRAHDESPACRSVTGFVREYPCLSVGLAFGLGVLAGSCAASLDT